MELTRRGLVGAGLATLAGGAGCLGGGSNVRYPAETGAGADEDREPIVEDSPSPVDDVESDAVAGSIPNEGMARSVRRIVSELAWFGEEYRSSVEAFRGAVDDAEREVRAVRELDSVGTNEVFRLRWAVGRAETVAQSQFGDHFPVAGVIESVGSNHLEVIEKFARRDDHDRLDAEINRLADFLNGLRSRAYIDRHLPSHPVQNRLVDRLRGGALSQSNPSLFAVYHGPTSFRALAYQGDQVVDERVPFPVEQTVAEGTFAGVATPERRGGVTVVRTYTPPERSEWPEPLERDIPEDEADEYDDYEDYKEDSFASVPPREFLDPRDFAVDDIHVQEYADAGAAYEALEWLRENRVAQEEYETLGGREWRRIRYRYDEDVFYVFMLQAGEFLVTVSPSETSWEERTTWREPLRRSWVL